MGGRGTGAIRNSTSTNAPVVERMDVSKLTESQRKVMDDVYNKVEYARTHTLDEWALKQRFHKDSIEDILSVQRWNEFGYKSQEQAIERTKNAVEEYKNTYKEYYENARNGQPLTTASTSTLKALEKRGFIRIIETGGTSPDTIELVERRRK